MSYEPELPTVNEYVLKVIPLITANKQSIREDTSSHCINCKNEVKFEKIINWIDDKNGLTAICPVCDIDTLVPLSKLPTDIYERYAILDKWYKWGFVDEDSH